MPEFDGIHIRIKTTPHGSGWEWSYNLDGGSFRNGGPTATKGAAEDEALAAARSEISGEFEEDDEPPEDEGFAHNL